MNFLVLWLTTSRKITTPLALRQDLVRNPGTTGPSSMVTLEDTQRSIYNGPYTRICLARCPAFPLHQLPLSFTLQSKMSS